MRGDFREDTLTDIKDLSLMPMPIKKATLLGVIIDCSGIFLDEARKLYSRKINIIDPTFNVEIFSPYEKSTFLTVYFNEASRTAFPSPVALGDLIYLKR